MFFPYLTFDHNILMDQSEREREGERERKVHRTSSGKNPFRSSRNRFVREKTSSGAWHPKTFNFTHFFFEPFFSAVFHSSRPLLEAAPWNVFHSVMSELETRKTIFFIFFGSFMMWEIKKFFNGHHISFRINCARILLSKRWLRFR